MKGDGREREREEGLEPIGPSILILFFSIPYSENMISHLIHVLYFTGQVLGTAYSGRNNRGIGISRTKLVFKFLVISVLQS